VAESRQRRVYGYGLTLSAGRPFKPYDPARGREEPPEVTAARERHRAVNDAIDAAGAAAAARDGEEVMPDIGPGYEWSREMADE
jgi:hypothetical protein